MLFTVDSAKEFLLTKVRDQAAHDAIPLDEIEQRMFLFSEMSGTPDIQAQEEFDRVYDDSAFEEKLTKLLRRAYARDKRNADSKREWTQALKSLRNEDFYGLVMVDLANIPRVDTGWLSSLVEELPLAVTELAIIALYWFVVMRDSGIMGSMPDWVRIIALIPFVALSWYVANVFDRVGPRQAQKPYRNTGENS